MMDKREEIRFEVIQISLEEQSPDKSTFHAFSTTSNPVTPTQKTPTGFTTSTSTPYPQSGLAVDRPPFYALHGPNATVIQEYLIRKYGVQSTTVILIDSSSGQVINFQGKEKISVDPKGVHFPWRYPTCSQILASGHLITSTTTTSTTKEDPSPDLSVDLSPISSKAGKKYQLVNATKTKTKLTGSIKALYFAAYWCPPCRTFVQLLKDVYKKINTERKQQQLEIVFVSSDRSQESFDKFFAVQPWSAIPFEDSQRREDLTAMYNIQGIPAVVIIGQNDNLITADGRTEITDDIDGVDFPWHARPVDELRDKHSTILTQVQCLIYFIGSDENEYERAENLLQPIALDHINSDIEEALQPRFFIATDCELSESLRIFMDLDESSAHVIIIHNSRYAVATESQIKDEKHIRDFLRKFQTSHPHLKYRFIPNKFI